MLLWQLYRWLSARLQHLQCITNGDTPYAIDIHFKWTVSLSAFYKEYCHTTHFSHSIPWRNPRHNYLTRTCNLIPGSTRFAQWRSAANKIGFASAQRVGASHSVFSSNGDRGDGQLSHRLQRKQGCDRAKENIFTCAAMKWVTWMLRLDFSL